MSLKLVTPGGQIDIGGPVAIAVKPLKEGVRLPTLATVTYCTPQGEGIWSTTMVLDQIHYPDLQEFAKQISFIRLLRWAQDAGFNVLSTPGKDD